MPIKWSGKFLWKSGEKIREVFSIFWWENPDLVIYVFYVAFSFQSHIDEKYVVYNFDNATIFFLLFLLSDWMMRQCLIWWWMLHYMLLEITVLMTGKFIIHIHMSVWRVHFQCVFVISKISLHAFQNAVAFCVFTLYVKTAKFNIDIVSQIHLSKNAQIMFHTCN